MLSLQKAAPSSFQAFLDSRSQTWDHEPRQAVWRCLDHLLAYILRAIAPNGGMSISAVRRFMAHRASRLDLEYQPAAAVGAYAFALEAVRERLRTALRSVKAFAAMSDSEISMLQTHMTEANFTEGDPVFHQGELGDSFYIVVDGQAECVRTEAKGVQLLATLQVGDCFGERALLRQEPRYASVVATGAEGLRSLRITREDFERLLGPLQARLTEQFSSLAQMDEGSEDFNMLDEQAKALLVKFHKALSSQQPLRTATGVAGSSALGARCKVAER